MSLTSAVLFCETIKQDNHMENLTIINKKGKMPWLESLFFISHISASEYNKKVTMTNN